MTSMQPAIEAVREIIAAGKSDPARAVVACIGNGIVPLLCTTMERDSALAKLAKAESERDEAADAALGGQRLVDGLRCSLAKAESERDAAVLLNGNTGIVNGLREQLSDALALAKKLEGERDQAERLQQNAGHVQQTYRNECEAARNGHAKAIDLLRTIRDRARSKMFLDEFTDLCATDALADLEAPASAWVACSGRMPEEREPCLAWVPGSKGGLVEHVYRLDEPFGWKSSRDHNQMWHVEDVEFWQPLPLPPRDGGR